MSFRNCASSCPRTLYGQLPVYSQTLLGCGQIQTPAFLVNIVYCMIQGDCVTQATGVVGRRLTGRGFAPGQT